MIFISCWLPELLGSLIKSHLQSCARDLKQHLHFLLLRTLVCSAARNVDLPSLKSNFQHPAGFLVFWTGKKNTPEWRRVWGESFFHSARMLAVSKTSCTVNESKKKPLFWTLVTFCSASTHHLLKQDVKYFGLPLLFF